MRKAVAGFFGNLWHDFYRNADDGAELNGPRPIEVNAEAYLDLLKRTLLNLMYIECELEKSKDQRQYTQWAGSIFDLRVTGRDWPYCAHTMIGWKRLENIQHCLGMVLDDDIPGDVIETGVFRGGACIFMRGILRAYESSKRVFVADSFKGLPKPTLSQDQSCDLTSSNHYLAVSLAQVQDNFKRYNLLDAQVVFVEGWFKDTLPNLQEAFSLIRLDGDMYESTRDAIRALYPRLSPGGFVIVDDYGSVKPCQQAIDEYRVEYNILDEMVDIDGSGMYWRKS